MFRVSVKVCSEREDRSFKGVVGSFVTSEVTEDNKSKETKDCQPVRCIAVTAADKRRHDKLRRSGTKRVEMRCSLHSQLKRSESELRRGDTGSGRGRGNEDEEARTWLLLTIGGRAAVECSRPSDRFGSTRSGRWQQEGVGRQRGEAYGWFSAALQWADKEREGGVGSIKASMWVEERGSQKRSEEGQGEDGSVVVYALSGLASRLSGGTRVTFWPPCPVSALVTQ